MPDTARPRRGLIVRFAVGDPAGARSAVWRLWTSRTKSDVYVSARALTSILKISLHESGDWQHAFTDTRGMAHVPPGQDRALARWYRPPEFEPGLTRAFEIIIPASEVTKSPYLEWDKNFRPGYADKEIVWVPPPPEGYATHFAVLFSSAEGTAATLPAWPGRTGAGSRLIAVATLPNSQTVWLVAFEPEISESNRQHVERNKRLLVEAARQLKEDPSETPELRALVSGGGDEETHWYLDISLADMKD